MGGSADDWHTLRRTRIITAAVAAAAGISSLLIPATAQAAGSVHLYKIYYDSPGSDGGSNSSLNAEYVQVRNTLSYDVNMKGWTLTDASNHKYTFLPFTLKKGATVTVRTGSGSDTTGTKYQDRAAYVWNNTSDKATLKWANGKVQDTCAYNSSSVDYKMC